MRAVGIGSDGLPVHSQQRFDEIEPETGALAVEAAGFVDLIEPIEDMWQIFGGNACAGVADGDAVLLAVRFEGFSHLTLQFQLHQIQITIFM